MAEQRRTKRAAATDAAPDGKKSKHPGFVMTLTVPAPENVAPVSLILRPDMETRRAARKAKAAATRVERYGRSDFAKFATPFAAAIASASAKKDRPVTLAVVINEMSEMTRCDIRFESKALKERFAWRGLEEGRWQISRYLPSARGLVAFPKGHARPSSGRCTDQWRFSPSPAARRPEELSCEPSSRPSAGCVVC